MKVYPDVDFYTKTRIHPKTVQKTSSNPKKQQPIENQKDTEYRNISYMGAQFLHLAGQGGKFAPLHPRQLRHCCRPLLYSLCKKRIDGFHGMQSCKIIFVARTCIVRCILHQSYSVETQHFAPNTLQQWKLNTLHKSSPLTNNTAR